jgi:hypothetical protein
MALQHDEQGFLTGRRLERGEIVERLDDLIGEVRALRRDLVGAGGSGGAGAPITPPSRREVDPAPIVRSDLAWSPAAESPAFDSAPRVAEPRRLTPDRDARGRFVARETRIIERHERVQREAHGPTAREQRQDQPLTPVSRERDARGRFTRDTDERAASEQGAPDIGLSGAVRDLGARISSLADATSDGMERGDPMVQGFNEVAQPLKPLARGFGKILSSVGDRRERRERVTWYRRFFTLFRDQHREDVIEDRRQRRLLENINRRRPDEGGGLGKWLPLLLAPLVALGSMLGGLGGTIAGSLASGAARLIGPVVAGVLSAVGLKKLAERLTGRSPVAGGGSGRRSGGPGPRSGPAPDGPDCARGGRGGWRRALRSARGLPGIGALLGLGFMASDVYASETDETATREEKDVNTGRAVGGGLGAGGGALAGGIAGAAIGSVVPVIGTTIGGIVGALAGAYFGGSAGEPIGEKVGGWVSELRGSDLVATIGEKWQYAVDFTTALSERAGADLSALWAQTSTALQEQFSTVGSALTSGWEATRAALESSWLTVSDAWSSASDWMQARWESVASASEAIWSGISERFAGASEWAREQFSGIKSAFDGVAEWAKGAWGSVKDTAQGAAEQAAALAESAKVATVEAASTANAWVAEQTGVDVAAQATAAADATARAVEQAGAAVESAWGSVTGWFSGAKEEADQKQSERVESRSPSAESVQRADEIQGASAAQGAAEQATAQSATFQPSVERAIASATEQTGVSPEYLRVTAQAGSGGNPNAVTQSGAVGLYPFTEQSGRAYGLVGAGVDQRRDPAASALAAAQLSLDNRQAMAASFLSSGLGVPSDLDVWMAHQRGAAAWTQERRAAAGGDPAATQTLASADESFTRAASEVGLSVNAREIVTIDEAALAADLGVGGVLRETATASTAVGAQSDVATLTQAMESSALAMPQASPQIQAPSLADHVEQAGQAAAVEEAATAALQEIERAGDEATSAWERLKERLGGWLGIDTGAAASAGAAGSGVAVPGAPAGTAGAATGFASGSAPGMGLITTTSIGHGEKALLERIAHGEGTSDVKARARGFESGYDVSYGFGKYSPKGGKKLSEMTLGEVKQYQEQMLANQRGNKLRSTAVGKYQFIRKTLNATQQKLGLSDDTIFSPEVQDQMGMELLKTRGYDQWRAGKKSDRTFQKSLAQEWASVADPNTGRSYYGQHVGTTDAEIKQAMAAAKSGSAAAAPGPAINDEALKADLSASGLLRQTASANAAAGAQSDVRTLAQATEASALALQQATGAPLPGQATQSVVRAINQGATRDKAITPELEARVHEAVRAVYGDGARADLYSGGQDKEGPGARRTGSTRHDDGKAGDFRFYDAEGKQITGDALGKIGQYWLAKGYGGVGMEMRGGGVHLDEHVGRARFWNYDNPKAKGRYTEGQKRAVERGLAGELPELKMDPAVAALPGAQVAAPSAAVARAPESQPSAPASTPEAAPAKPTLTTARRDEMRSQLAAMRQRAEAQLQREDLDPEIRGKYEDLLVQVGEKEQQVEQAAVSDGPGPASAATSPGPSPSPAPVAGAPAPSPAPESQPSAPASGEAPAVAPLDPASGLFASFMSRIPGTSESWKSAAAGSAAPTAPTSPSATDRAPLDPVTALLQPLEGAAGGLLSGLPAGLGAPIGAGIQPLLGAVAGGLSGPLGRLKDLGGMMGGIAGGGSPSGALSALGAHAAGGLPGGLAGLAASAGGLAQAPAAIGASVGQIGIGAVGQLAGLVSQSTGSPASAMPRALPAVVPPRSSEPAEAPPEAQVPLSIGGGSSSGSLSTPDISRDVSDRRIAHIVTGAYSSGGL